jgi:hypothetical protein
MVLETVSGKDLERSAGPMTLVEMAVAAARIRSFSTRILGRFGTMVDKMPTTSSARSAGNLTAIDCVGGSLGRFSERLEDPELSKLAGRAVKMAVRRRKNKS